jgi:hypothetical protein
MVDKYTAPDNTSQTASAYKANIDNAVALNNLTAGDYFVHAQDTPDMTVKASAGTRLLAGTLSTDAAQNTGTITAPSVNPRIDRVTLDITDGTVAVVTGTESTSPAAPSISDNTIPLAQISLTTSTTSITNSDITDERTLIGATPLQSAFHARLSSTQSSVTGDGTAYTIPFDTETEDRGGDYNNSTYTFTAPVKGLYMFVVNARLTGIAAGHEGLLSLVTSNRTYSDKTGDLDTQEDSTSSYTLTHSWVADMDASDTAYIELDISGGSKVINVQGNATDGRSVFSGWLIG